MAAELSLEQIPLMSTLAGHVAPNVQDGESPFSKLLEPRWAEVTLGHLRDQEDFLTKRRNIGKGGTKSSKENEDDAMKSEKKKPTPKAKAKANAAAEKNQDA